MDKTWAKILTTFLTVLVMALIFVSSAQNADESNMTSAFFSNLLVRFFRPEYDSLPPAEQQAVFDTIQAVVRKTAHFSAFALLGVCLRLCLESWFGESRRLWLWSLLGCVLYAVSDELHQLISNGRSCEIRDMLIDSAGALAGIVLAGLILCSVRYLRLRKA